MAEQLELVPSEPAPPVVEGSRRIPAGIAARWPEGSAMRAFWAARNPSDEQRLRASLEEFERLGPGWDRHAARTREKLRRIVGAA